MKVIQRTDGSIEYEVLSAADVKLLQGITCQTQHESVDDNAAQLTDYAREAYEILKEYPEGIHVGLLAEWLECTANQVNGKIQALKKAKLVEPAGTKGVWRLKR